MTSFAPITLFSGYEFKTVLHCTRKSVVYEASSPALGPCVVKFLNKPQYSVADMRRMTVEFSFLNSFDSRNIIKVLALEKGPHHAMIVMEHLTDTDLRSLILAHPTGIAIEDVFAVGIGIARALDYVHREHHIIHCDVNPSNILYSLSTKCARLIDFGAAQGFTDRVEQHSFTPQYMSPEQTERLDLDLDYRTDLYSLGATLYHVLTGELPLRATSVAEYMMAHLTQPIADAREVRREAPAMLAAVIARLLEKDRNNRYQSGHGLEHDLVLIRDGDQNLFALGQQDQPFIFVPPGTLYGRADEMYLLEQRYQLCKETDTLQFVLIAGGSGMGKSSLIYHFFQRNAAAAVMSEENNSTSKAGPVDGMDRSTFNKEMEASQDSRRSGREENSEPSIDSASQTLSSQAHSHTHSQSRVSRSGGTHSAVAAIRKRYHLRGKFEIAARSRVYYAFKQCFTELLYFLTALPALEQETVVWAIKERCSGLAAFVQLMPAFESLFGKLAVPECPPSETATRLQTAVADVISAFSSLGIPLVLFIDDLQWMDSASAQMLESLVTRQTPMLLIGAYRDNEVSPSHPLMLILSRTKSLIAPPVVELGCLSTEHVQDYLADCLKRDGPEVEELAQVVHRKCGGDPFWLQQFMAGLFSRRLIRYMSESRSWSFDLASIETLDCTSNVVDFCIKMLQQAEVEVQKALACAALVGAIFDSPPVEFMCDSDFGKDVDVVSALSKANIASFIRSKGTGYSFVQDRIQEAALRLLSPEDKERLHFRMGSWLLEELEREGVFLGESSSGDLLGDIGSVSEKYESQVQGVVCHFLECQPLITDASLRVRIAERCLEAGLHARSNCAYRSAETYVSFGRTLIIDNDAAGAQVGAGSKDHSRVQKLRMKLLFLLSELEYLCKDYDRSEEIFNEASKYAGTLDDYIALYRFRIRFLTSMGKMLEVADAGQPFLEKLGHPMPLTPSKQDLIDTQAKIVEALNGRSPAEVTLPRCTDKVIETVISVCIDMMPAAYLSGNLERVFHLVMMGALLTLQHGVGQLSPTAICYYGWLLTYMKGFEGNQTLGADFALRAVEMAEALGDKVCLCRTLVVCGHGASFRASPAQLISFEEKAYRVGLEAHDRNYTAFAALHHLWIGVTAGVSWSVWMETFRGYEKEVVDTGLVEIHDCLRGQAVLAAEVMCVDVDTIVPKGWIADAVKGDKACSAMLAKASFNVYSILRNHLMGRVDEAFFHCERFFVTDPVIQGLVLHYEGSVYVVLACAAFLRKRMRERGAQAANPGDTDDPREAHAWKLIDDCVACTAEWAKYGPAMHQSRAMLQKAEVNSLRGKRLAALCQFREAQRHALENKYYNIAAMAADSAIAMLEDEDEACHPELCIEVLHAKQWYRLWGVTAKLKSLDARYPSIKEEVPQSSSTSTPSSRFGLHTGTVDQSLATQLTFNALLKAANVITSEIRFDDLKLQLLSTILENAGGTRIVLLVCNEPEVTNEGLVRSVGTGAVRVAAEAFFRNDELVRESRDFPYDNYTGLPHLLLDSFLSGREPLVLNNVAEHLASADPYFFDHPVKSILCHPIVHGEDVVGMVYLEHSELTNVYAPKHVEVTKILLSNIAGALVNARLYATLQNRTTALEATNALLVKTLKVRDVILSNTSHELRTPLNGILGLSEAILMEPTITLKMREQVNIINACARSLLALVNDILDTARLQQAEIVLQRENFVLKDVVEEVLQVTRFLVRKPVVLLNEVAPDLPLLNADRTRVRQIIFNLVGNAIKFTPHGSVKVFSICPPGATSITLGVKDTGIGIPRNNFDVIFEAFGQADHGPSRQFEGSGLGLSICRSLMELHGGSIRVESAVGQGSTFFITFPLDAEGGAATELDCSCDFLESTHYALALAATDMARAPTPEDGPEREDIPDLGEGDQKSKMDSSPSLPLVVPGTQACTGLGSLARHASNGSVGADSPPRAVDLRPPSPRSDNPDSVLASKGDEDFEPEPEISVPRSLRQSVERRPLILVVDDNAVNLLVIQNMLGDSVNVVCVDSGQDCIDYVMKREDDVDCVLLDWMMPIMDGIECCKRLRRVFSGPELPVIFLTARSDVESIAVGLGVGGNDFLCKPVVRQELLARTQNMVHYHREFQRFLPLAVRDVLVESSVRDLSRDAAPVASTTPSHAATLAPPGEFAVADRCCVTFVLVIMERGAAHPACLPVLLVPQEGSAPRSTESLDTRALPLLAALADFLDRSLPPTYRLAHVLEDSYTIAYLVAPDGFDTTLPGRLCAEFSTAVAPLLRNELVVEASLVAGVSRSRVTAGYLPGRSTAGVLKGACLRTSLADALNKCEAHEAAPALPGTI